MDQYNAMQKLRKWVDTELKLDGYEHQVILDKIDELIREEWDEDHALDQVLNDMVSDLESDEEDSNE